LLPMWYESLINHGFHCEDPEHAAKVHTICKLDENMHYSCCDPEFMKARWDEIAIDTNWD